MSEEALVAGSTKSRIQFLLRDLLVYGFASALVPLMGLIAVPILTRYLSKSDYGAFELVLAYIGVAAIVGGFGQDSAFARFYYDSSDDAHRRAVIRHTVWNQAAAATAAFIAFATLGPWVLPVDSSVANLPVLVLLAALAVPTTVALNFVRNFMKWTFRRKQYMGTAFGYAGLVLAGYGIFVVLLRLQALGAVLAQVCAAGIIAIAGVASLRPRGARAAGDRFSTHLLRYGAPYVALGVISQGFRAVDKTILTLTSGLAATASYSVGFKIATIVLIIESTFHIAWGPIAVAIYKEANAPETYGVGFRVLSWLLSGALLAISFLSSSLVAIVTPGGYETAPQIATIICVGFVAQSLAGITAIGIELAKRPSLMIVSWASGALVAVVLMFLLASRMGAVGVALGSACGLAVEGVVRTGLAYRVYHVRFDLASGLAPFAMTIVFVAIASLVCPDHQFLIKSILSVLFASLATLALALEWRRLA